MTDRSKLSFSRLMAGEGRPAPRRSDRLRLVDRDVRRNLAFSLEDMRGKLKMPKSQFCKTIGIDYRRYCRIMNGKIGLSVANIVILSRLTGWSVMRLLKLKESGYFEDMVE